MIKNYIEQANFEETGFSYTMSLISGKYKMVILYCLMEYQVVRFNELKRYLKKISDKTLSMNLKELEAAVQQYDSQKVTGNAVLDSILTQKQMQCAQKNIQFICNADGRLLQNLAVRDISNIFGNIIDNAMECVAKYEEEEDRIIQGAVYQKNQFLIIRFENCCYEQLKFKKGIPVTTKEDKTRHGYGVTSIIYTVKKYNGHVQLKCEDNWFVIKVLIPIM